MSEIKLLPCPFCGGEAELKEYYETCDGRGDTHAKITCLNCLSTMALTRDEFVKAEKDFKYKGGYYSKNKKFWNGMHQRLIEKWNTRKPMEEIVDRLEEIRDASWGELYEHMVDVIHDVKEVGGMNE